MRNLFAFFACGVILLQSLNAAAGIEAGDRNLPIQQVYPPDAFYHNSKGGRVLDVTKPPFNAKGDGVTDDTKALIAAMRFVRDRYERLEEPGYSYCTRKRSHNWVIYLPDGEYLVSDTVSQGWPAQAINILDGWAHVQTVGVESLDHEKKLNAGGKRRVYSECNWAIRIVGQSRDKTLIRLKDSSSGFGKEAKKPVLAFCLLACGSNVNVGNIIRNVTIDTGFGNPGAVGLEWSSSNYGGINNVAIRSGEGNGPVGLLLDRRNATGYLHDLIIDGFEVGLELTSGAETVVALEYVTLKNQRRAAVAVGSDEGRNCLSARKVSVCNAPVVVKAGRNAMAMFLDCVFISSSNHPAAIVLQDAAHLFARNLKAAGYAALAVQGGRTLLDGGYVKEYASMGRIGLKEKEAACPLKLPVKDTPVILPEQDISKWACVDAYGAVGDGKTDDTAAVQRAMDAGKPVVYFPKANYVINGTIDIPATVKEIACLFGAVYRSVASEKDGAGLFRVTGVSQEPLYIHGAVSAGGVFLDHEAARPVILEDIEVYFNHCRGYAEKADMLFPSPAAQNTTVWRLYRNTRPDDLTKEVFVNDSLFFAADQSDGDFAVENAKVWARMINSEHLPGAQYSFRRSDIWILGFKSENAKRLFYADSHSRLEVFGGSFLNWSPKMKEGPAIVSRDSAVSAVFYMGPVLSETLLEAETKGTITATFPASRLVSSDADKGVVSLFSDGRAQLVQSGDGDVACMMKRLFDASARIERVADGFGFTEGPVADGRGNLYFTDIPNGRIHVRSVDGKISVFREQSGRANGLCFDRVGNLLACEGAARRVTSTAPDGTVKVLCDRFGGKRLNSPNDLWVDLKGGIYFTDPRYPQAKWVWSEKSTLTHQVDDPDNAEEQDARGLYYLPPDGAPAWRCEARFTNPNGVIGTADGKWLYVSDTDERKVYRFAIREDGSLAEGRVLIPDYSDGMTLDEEGNIYLTNGGVNVYTPEGQRITTIEVPESAANVGFAGNDRRTLFITAGRGVYALRMNVRGQ